jgi:hypothetical protein
MEDNRIGPVSLANPVGGGEVKLASHVEPQEQERVSEPTETTLVEEDLDDESDEDLEEGSGEGSEDDGADESGDEPG